jgi:hypothetical protein
MRLLAGLVAWSVFVVAIGASLASQERAEERVVRVIPGPLPAKPWPRCGSFADERITRNVAYEISSADPDGKWTFDSVGFGHRSPREDVANCTEAFVPSTNGCRDIKVFQRSQANGEWVGVTRTCVPGLSEGDCTPGSTQPVAGGFLMHRAISPKGADGCWVQIRNWRTGATDFKLQWVQ